MHKLFEFALVPRLPGTEKLYYRKNGGNVSYDTYFNCIPLQKLRRYTTVTALGFSSEVTICTEHGVLKKGDYISLSEIPASAELMYLQTDTIPGALSVFAEGHFTPVRAAIIICTFRREALVRANVDYLLEHMQDHDCEIILVDNDSSIPKDAWDSDRIHVIHNENNGGSGGFSCGMQYAAAQNRFTHMLLMDDDITIDFAAIRKMTGFLSFLKEDYKNLSIAGSMLYADQPTLQFECGGFFEDSGLQRGHGYHFDLTDRGKLIENEREKDVNYGGWWMMCMPIHYAANGQLPAPFFLKYDDVEYALRCRLQIITLNGVGVWHQDFGSKYNSTQEYFNTRNYLFVMQRHSSCASPKQLRQIARYLLLEKLCRQQYQMAEAVLCAYADFLRGEEYLRNIDHRQKLAELKKLNYEMLSEDELLQKYGITFDADLYSQSGRQVFRRYMQLLLYGHLIPSFLCRKLTITDVLADKKEHYFGAGKVLHFSLADRCGYVTQKSLSELVRQLLKLKHISRKGN